MLEPAIADQILRHMQAVGIEPRGNVEFVFDGKVHRFATVDDKGGEKSGAYWAYSDGWPNWGIMDFHKHERMIKSKLDAASLTCSESEALTEQLETRSPNRQEQERREREADEQARANAYREYHCATHEGVENHPYCKLKHIHDLPRLIRVVVQAQPGDICRVGDLLIPILNCESRRFQAIEKISRGVMSNGKHMKGIYSGTHVKGGCFEFPMIEPEAVYIAEGFATCASVHEFMTRRGLVVCAMNCGNLINVARVYRERTKLPVMILADNDASGVGVKKANEVVEAGYADSYYIPPMIGDWNDYLTRNK